MESGLIVLGRSMVMEASSFASPIPGPSAESLTSMSIYGLTD